MKLVKLTFFLDHMVGNISNIGGNLQTIKPLDRFTNKERNCMPSKHGIKERKEYLKRAKNIYHGQIYFKFNNTMRT